MLVPVSPSGTGKTLMAFRDSTCRSSQAVAVANIARRSLPDSEVTSVGAVIGQLLEGDTLFPRARTRSIRADASSHLALARGTMLSLLLLNSTPSYNKTQPRRG